MHRSILSIVILLLFSLLCPAAERVALVIGNNAYQHGPALKNCVNDATQVAAKLKECGFQVISVNNVSLADFEKKLREFNEAAAGAQVAWFFYAGHGAEVDGKNYLIPVEADVQKKYEVPHKTFPLDQVLGAMEEAKTPLKVVVLDSCRDNPFGERSWGGSRGLAKLEKEPEGTIIAYATAPGMTAADGNGAHSPYTTALLAALDKPSLEIEMVFKLAGGAVSTATNKRQKPWVSSSFYGSFVLRLGTGGGGGAAPQPAPFVPPPVSLQPDVAGSPLDQGKVGSRVEVPLPGGGKIFFRYCPAGNFMMGSPAGEEGRSDDEKQVPVRITKGFWLAETECTQGAWQAVAGENPSHFKGSEQLPVEMVSWEDVQGFIGKMNRAGGLPAGWKWALPTEAQWEYACRADKPTSVFSFGDTLTSRQANFSESKLSKTVGVGSYTANAWGLNDMHGNVYEWCADWYDEELTGGADPVGASTGVYRVIRGGSWYDLAAGCRAALRNRSEPGFRSNFRGFRPALVPSK